MVNIYINNPEGRAEYDLYIERVKPIVESYGGEYIIRTEDIVASSEKWSPDRVIVIRFPDKERLDACFGSDEYMRIKDLRVNSVDSRILIVKGV